MNTLSSLLKFIANSIAPIISNQTARKVLAAPSGATGKPSFRELKASDITSETFSTDRIPNLDASKINSGTFGTARIPNLDTSKITSGVFGTARIPNLDASKVTSGTFASDRIPSLNASKINAGVLNAARIPDGFISSDGGFIFTCKSRSNRLFTNGYLSSEGSATETSSYSANLHIASGGKIAHASSSSRRYKENIAPLSDDALNAHRLYDLPVVQFKYKDGYLTDEDDPRIGKTVNGFIAEDVDEIYPIAVEYANGNVEDWNIRYIVPPMLKLIQEQHEEIENLKAEVQRLADERSDK